MNESLRPRSECFIYLNWIRICCVWIVIQCDRIVSQCYRFDHEINTHITDEMLKHFKLRHWTHLKYKVRSFSWRAEIVNRFVVRHLGAWRKVLSFCPFRTKTSSVGVPSGERTIWPISNARDARSVGKHDFPSSQVNAEAEQSGGWRLCSRLWIKVRQIESANAVRRR